MMLQKWIATLLLAFAVGTICWMPSPAYAADTPTDQQVMSGFSPEVQSQNTLAPQVFNSNADNTRRWVMFALAVPLLILLLITGGLGISMGLYGKDLFLPHLIFAGLSITLAIAHAIVGLVWFRPHL